MDVNQRGFLALGLAGYLGVAAAVVIAVLGAGVAVQTKRVEAAREAVVAEQAAKAQALAAVTRLAAQRQAAEDALATRDTLATEIRRLRASQQRALTEVARVDPDAREWIDRPVPAAVRRLLEHGGGAAGPGAPGAAGDAAAPVRTP